MVSKVSLGCTSESSSTQHSGQHWHNSKNARATQSITASIEVASRSCHKPTQISKTLTLLMGEPEAKRESVLSQRHTTNFIFPLLHLHLALVFSLENGAPCSSITLHTWVEEADRSSQLWQALGELLSRNIRARPCSQSSSLPLAISPISSLTTIQRHLTESQ